MAKPTLLQTLLGRPSQTYSFPPDKSYHSSKKDFVRAANAASAARAGHLSAPVGPALPHTANGVIHVPFSQNEPLPSRASVHDEDSDDDVFYTPFTSPNPDLMIPLPDTQDDSSSSSADSAASYSTSPTSDDTHRFPSTSDRSPHKSYTYTDQDWAKEVRWLVPPAKASSSKRRSQPEPVHYADLPSLPVQPSSPRPRSTSNRVRSTKARMTALVEEDEDGTVEGVQRSSSLSRTRVSVSRSNSLNTRPSSRSSQHTRSTSISSRSHPSKSATRTVELPALLPAASAPTAHGYTTLTLPRASYKPDDPWRTLGGGRIDLAREGRAQGTMASIEVVAGLSRGARGSKRRTEDLGTALALSAHLPPPSYVPNSHVLVQVYAVGLEGLDKSVVAEKVGTSGKGFVPGRSLVGRVMECGWEVHNEFVAKGDWVVGLLDIKKCGALAEFVLLERHRVQRVPHPTFPKTNFFPSSSPSITPLSSNLTLESLALLPLLGVPAHRAVRTYTATTTIVQSHIHPRGTAVVLRAQDGVGGLATLMLRGQGVRVIAHIESSIVGIPETTSHEAAIVLWTRADDAHATRGNRCFAELCTRLRSAGVAGICVGAPTAVLDALVSSPTEVDFVLDTVGGRGVWESARRLLASGGNSERGEAQFTTVVGDVGGGRAIPTAQDHWRAGVRSWKRAIGAGSGSTLPSPQTSGSVSPASSASSAPSPRGKRRARPVVYSWVSCAAGVDFEGADVRDALGAVLALVESGVVGLEGLMSGEVYGAGRVLPLEHAAEAFGGTLLEGGGSAVVRVVV